MDSNLFNDLMGSVNEMVAIENGTATADRIHRMTIPNVKIIRKNTGMNQSEFASLIGTSTSLVQSWELARRIPNGTALKMLFLIERNPNIVDALRAI